MEADTVAFSQHLGSLVYCKVDGGLAALDSKTIASLHMKHIIVS